MASPLIPPSQNTMRYALCAQDSQVGDLRRQFAKSSECRLSYFEKYFKEFFVVLGVIHKQLTKEHFPTSEGIRQKLLLAQDDFYARCISSLSMRIRRFSDALDDAFENPLQAKHPSVIRSIFAQLQKEIDQLFSRSLSERRKKVLDSVQTSLHAALCAFELQCKDASFPNEEGPTSFSLMRLAYSDFTPGVARFKPSKETVVFQALLLESQIEDIQNGTRLVTNISWAQMGPITRKLASKIEQLKQSKIKEPRIILLRAQTKISCLQSELQRKSLICIHTGALVLKTIIDAYDERLVIESKQKIKDLFASLNKEINAFDLNPVSREGAHSLAKSRSLMHSAATKLHRQFSKILTI